MARQKLRDGKLVDFTPAEEAARDADDLAADAARRGEELARAFGLETLARCAEIVPGCDTLDQLATLMMVWPAISPPASWLRARDIYDYGRAAAGRLEGLTRAQLGAIDPKHARPFAAFDQADQGWPT